MKREGRWQDVEDVSPPLASIERLQHALSHARSVSTLSIAVLHRTSSTSAAQHHATRSHAPSAIVQRKRKQWSQEPEPRGSSFQLIPAAWRIKREPHPARFFDPAFHSATRTYATNPPGTSILGYYDYMQALGYAAQVKEKARKSGFPASKLGSSFTHPQRNERA